MSLKTSQADAIPADGADLAGYELAVGVAGGIAAYKVCHVVSRLVQRGCGVSVAMTEAGTRFVGPATFQALTGRQVFISLWQSTDDHNPNHLRLTENADLFLIAPATANIIGKFAAGIGDDLVSTLILGRDCPILLAPAMNTRMWNNPIVQDNVDRIARLDDVSIIEPAEGWLACRTVGHGRMAESETIIAAVVEHLKHQPPRGAGRP